MGKSSAVKKHVERHLADRIDEAYKRAASNLPSQTKIYVVSASKEATVYLFSVHDVADAAISGGLTGSGGSLVMILEEKGRDVRVLYEDNLIEVYGLLNRGQYPSVYVKAHGSVFGRSGSEYGFSPLKYNLKEKRYVLGPEERNAAIRECDIQKQ